MNFFKRYIIQTLIVLLSLTTSIQVFADWEHSPGQLTVDILQIPTPLIASGRYYLVYELHLTNYHAAPFTLKSLTVNSPNKREPGSRARQTQEAILGKYSPKIAE
jgi:hypothetical protein